MVSFRTVAVASAAVALPRACGRPGQDERRCPSARRSATAKKLGQATHRQRLLPVQADGQRRRLGVVRARPASTPSTCPKKGDGAAPDLIVPTGQKVAGATDAAGAAFWFNGQDALSLNPRFAAVGLRQEVHLHRRQAGRVGPAAGEKPKPMTVKFTKAGTYKVYCDLHPGMEASVTVAKKGADGPDGQAGRGGRQEAGRRRHQGRQGPRRAPTRAPTPSTSASPPRAASSTSAWSRPTSPSRRGTTVKFQMTKGSYEAHTATFGPGNIEDPSVLPRRRSRPRSSRPRSTRAAPTRAT